MDFALYERLNGLAAEHHGIAEVFRFFALDGQVVFIVLLAALFLARGKWRRRRRRLQRATRARGGSAHRVALGPPAPLRSPPRRRPPTAVPVA
jgi:hypothetical protein